MNVEELLALFDWQQRREVEYFGLVREIENGVVRQAPAPGQKGDGCIIWTDLSEMDVDEAIRREVAHFQEIGHGFEWKVFAHDAPTDLVQRLAAHGFEVEERESVMLLDLEAAPDWLWQPYTHDVRRILDPSGVADVMTVQERVWNGSFDWIGESLREELSAVPERISIYCAYADGQPVSSAWVRFHAPGEFASLWGGSTLGEYRGRGFYTALLAARAQEAIRRDFRLLTVDAGDQSRPILAKLGFQVITHAQACRWHPVPPEAKEGEARSRIPS
jgi:GNAT superfamily N-acetyltransferase